MHKIALALGICAAGAVLAGPTAAQVPAPAAPAANAAPLLFITPEETQALIARAKAEIKPGAASINLPMLRLLPYRANLEYRVAPTVKNAHVHDAEFVFVVAGSGSVMLGGTITNPQPPANDTIVGDGITGGTIHQLKAGDSFLVPPGQAHWFNSINGSMAVIALHVPHPVEWPR